MRGRNHLADRSLEERLWAKTWIDESHTYNGTPCWRWSGALTGEGYGAITIDNDNLSIHRLSASIHLGLDLNKTRTLVCHHCDMKDCWNPGHLFLGSNSGNVKDSANKGRHKNSKKTHCPRGHEYTLENTALYNHKRQCITCDRERSKLYQQNKRDSAKKELIQ